jgi:hypothetical protein
LTGVKQDPVLKNYPYKGRASVDSLNLVRLVLIFVMGRHPVTGDLSQFYNTLKLREDFFNLKRFLWRIDETLKAVIVTLMYVVKSVSAQSEEAMIRLAKISKQCNQLYLNFSRRAVYVKMPRLSSRRLTYRSRAGHWTEKILLIRSSRPYMVPKVVSKVACVFDLRGLLAPVLASLRMDDKRTSKAVNTWDEAVPADLRQKWVKNFWLLEHLRGLGFQRPVMPEDTLNDRA